MSEPARMGKKSSFLGALAVLVILTGVRKTEAAAGSTYQHFKILCRLAGIAKAPLKKFELTGFKPEEIYETARRRAVDFGGKNETARQDKGESTIETKDETGISLEEALKEAKETKKDSEFRSSDELRQLALIVEKMKTLKDDAKNTQDEIGTKEKEIRLGLAQAIYGKGAGEADFKKQDGSTAVDFKTEDAAVSQIVANANLAGKTISGTGSTASCEGAGAELAVSIVNDLYCVCGSGGSSTTAHTCYHGITGSASWGQLTAPSATSTEATVKALLDECKKVSGNATLSPQAIQSGLATFFSKIGHGSGHENANYLFGITNGASSTPCSRGHGDSACVNYGHFLKTGDNQNQIPWVKKLQEAEENLEKRAELIQKLHREVDRLHDLELAAQRIQRSTAISTTPFAPPGSQTTGTKGKLTQPGQENIATVSEAPTSSAFASAVIPRFILPWTLFI